MEDLERAIELYSTALEVRPVGHKGRDATLNELAYCLGERIDLVGSMEDHEKAIDLNSAAIELRPEGHRDRHESLNDLAACLCRRYNKLGSFEDLKRATELCSAAVEHRQGPVGHQRNSSESIIYLTDSLRNRYGWSKEDPEKATAFNSAVMELCPEGHPRRDAVRSILAFALRNRSECHHEIQTTKYSNAPF